MTPEKSPMYDMVHSPSNILKYRINYTKNWGEFNEKLIVHFIVENKENINVYDKYNEELQMTCSLVLIHCITIFAFCSPVLIGFAYI